MVDLSIDFCGVKFKNPILTASGTFGFAVEFRELVDLNKLGGIVFKSVTLQELPGNPQPRIFELPFGLVNSIGLENKGIHWFLNHLLPQIENLDTNLIPSIYGFSFEEYVELLQILDRVPRFQMIEINISCPNVQSIIHKLEKDLSIFENFVKTIRKATQKILIVKLSPSLYNIVEFARIARKAGIDALSLINTLPVVTFDWRRRKSNLSTIWGGFSGPPLKGISQKLCMDIYKVVDIPIIGIGGIFSADDVMEYLACGASLVEVGTANFIKPDITIECIENLQKIVEQEKITSLQKFSGCYIWANHNNNILKIYTDGASLNNPGPSACAYLFKNQNDEFIMSRTFFLGHSTNNVAEYTALLYALSFLEERKQFLDRVRELHIFSDSQLMHRQLKGLYKIKNVKLRELNRAVHDKLESLNKIYCLFEIDRKLNFEADRLCKNVLSAYHK
ncbi:MAG: dihydroorotate dehydrogenase [Planctomycetota bacterium]